VDERGIARSSERAQSESSWAIIDIQFGIKPLEHIE
jgi:hypothetical protein